MSAKELFVSSTPHETKVAIVENDQLVEIYYERENEYTLAGSIYKGRVTRVLPGMQSAFVDIGLERDAFLYVSDFYEGVDDLEEIDQIVTKPQDSARQDAGRQNARGRQPGQQPREQREQREPRPQIPQQPIEAEDAVEAEAHALEDAHSHHAHGNDGQGEAPGAASGPQQQRGEQDESGARRWRGRRRRGRGRSFEQRLPEHREHSAHTNAPSEGPAQLSHESEEEFEPAPLAEASVRSAPQNRPLVLPGESIAKWRSADEEAEDEQTKQPQVDSQQSRLPRHRPSTEIDLEAILASGQFAGGALPGEMISKYKLPGESISRYSVGQPAPVNPFVRPPAAAVKDTWKQTETEHQLGGVVDPISTRAEDSGETGSQSEAGGNVGLQPGNPADEESGGRAGLQPGEEHHHGYGASAPVGQRAAEQSELATSHSADEARDEFLDGGRAGLLPGVSADNNYGALAPESREQHSNEAAPAETLAGALLEEGLTNYEFSPGEGNLEHEEMDEEESDLPHPAQDFDDIHFDELEEETFEFRGSMMVEGSELGKAVEEAYLDRVSTGGFESEGLEEEDSAEEAELTDAAEDLEPEDEEADREEETEGAAVSAGGATQQKQDRRRGKFQRDRGRKDVRSRRNIPRAPMPQISELLKEGQEVLVQIAKEPIGKKGARITSHIALPGRFLVYMPTVNHLGVSRKIASDEERQRLKRILISERGEAHGGFIVRTAAAGASEDDLRADIRFLINLWTEIKQRSESSKPPALIYHDLNLVERILRDQVTANFSQIWVDTETEYERIVRFVGRFQQAMARRVKLYTKETPLFEQFNIQEEINKALKSKVWLKSGGYIVINQTEALVAIDINTGKYVGKTTRLEDTIVKTNVDAIQEIVRQIRLRDLGGIIVIDFIDMDERRNRYKVMQALEEALQQDRAPSKVLQFNDFGLVAITRKRVKQSLERTLGTTCDYCTGTGLIKSVQTVCNEIYVEMRKMARHFDHPDVTVRVNPEVAKALKANSGRLLQELEDLTGKTVLVKSDALVHQERFDIQ